MARDIISEIGATDPENVDGLMLHHEEAIAVLPDHLRTEVVTAAQDRSRDEVAARRMTTTSTRRVRDVAAVDGGRHGGTATGNAGRRQGALAAAGRAVR